MNIMRPRLLAVTAIAAAFSIVANGVGAVTAATAPATTRLGVSIEKDVAAQASTAAQRSRTLDMREQAARATEMRLKADLAGREAVAAEPGAAAVAPVGEQYDSLARVYQAMKPARAAPVFEQLDMYVQLEVAKRMRDRSTASIMAAMSSKGAADLSMALARKSATPVNIVPPPPRVATADAAATPAVRAVTPEAAAAVPAKAREKAAAAGT